MGHCSPSVVAELVQQQVAFEVILLDSKCYPILESDTTKSHDFWKSNRKVLAASKSLYIKLTGSSANPRHADMHSDDDLGDVPQPKRCCLSGNNKLDKTLRYLQKMDKRENISEMFSSIFECKDTMQTPLCSWSGVCSI